MDNMVILVSLLLPLNILLICFLRILQQKREAQSNMKTLNDWFFLSCEVITRAVVFIIIYMFYLFLIYSIRARFLQQILAKSQRYASSLRVVNKITRKHMEKHFSKEFHKKHGRQCHVASQPQKEKQVAVIVQWRHSNITIAVWASFTRCVFMILSNIYDAALWQT